MLITILPSVNYHFYELLNFDDENGLVSILRIDKNLSYEYYGSVFSRIKYLLIIWIKYLDNIVVLYCKIFKIFFLSKLKYIVVIKVNNIYFFNKILLHFILD